LGLIAGLMVSPGRYQAEFAAAVGWQGVYQIDVLPDVIAFRMNTNVVQLFVADKGAHPLPNGAGVLFNWAVCLAETLIVVVIVMGAGIQRAREMYAEKAGRWMKKAVAYCPQGTGQPLIQALETGRLHDFKDNLVPMDDDEDAFCELILEYCPP